MIAILLIHESNESIVMKARFAVKTIDGRESEGYSETKRGVTLHGFGFVGTPDLITRSQALSALQNGKLVVEVQLEKIEPPAPTFIAKNPLCNIILGKFMDEKSADVVFEVGSLKTKNAAETKRAKTSPVVFHAHRLILEEGAPTLFNYASVTDGKTPIQINDITPGIFKQLLYYVYGGVLGKEFLEENARDIIDAADKLGVVHLKLEAEANLVASTTFTVDNVMELLLYGDEKNCALLKESAMDFVAQHQKEVMATVSFIENAPGYLIKDLLMAMNMEDSMRVANLRKSLHDKGLDIDGSREMMIALLKENS
ncbi:hypothetical protein ACHAWF_017915 [Thalassiosira exigua]